MGSTVGPHNRIKSYRLLLGWSQARLGAALGTDGITVCRWERGYQKVSPYYQEKLCQFFGVTADKLGLVENPKHIEIKVPGMSTQQPPENSELQSILPSHYSNKNKQDIILLFQETENQDMNIQRRQLLQEIFGITATSITLPYNPSFYFDNWKHGIKPSSINDAALFYFEQHTEHYWQDRYNAITTADILLPFVLEHFKKISNLLGESLSTSVRSRLSRTLGETSLLAGTLLFDMGSYTQSRMFIANVLKITQDIMVCAVAWGWMSFTWTYSGNYQTALSCIQEAHKLAAQHPSMLLRSWLSAVEAEIWSHLKDHDACIIALDTADKTQNIPFQENSYLLQFDNSLLAGYKGICYQRLFHIVRKKKSAYLENTQIFLKDALNSLTPTTKLREPKLLADIAETHLLQGDIESACDYTMQAATKVFHTKSRSCMDRLGLVRQHLEKWEKTMAVHDLDDYLASSYNFIPGWHKGVI